MTRHRPTLADLGEDALVRRLTRGWTGVGDDCAVLPPPRTGQQWLFKTDAIGESTHFTPDTAPTLIGRKALARCVSDIAAMGGSPVAAVVTLAAPRDLPVDRAAGIYAGLRRVARQWGVQLVGGETVRAPRLLLSVALLGTVPSGRAISRSGARPGEVILVTGTLGGSRRGKHLRFTPRLAEGQWLARHARPTAMMDVSDGMATDLPRLCRASRCGWELDLDALPRTRGCDVASALTDGEDFELLLTLPVPVVPRVLKRWPFRTPLTAIGFTTAPAVCHPEFRRHGYDAFRES